MAKKNSCSCAAVSADDDGSLYVIMDVNNGELVAEAIEFNEIEDEVQRYLDENEYTEDDVDFIVYKATSIEIEISTKPKITIKRY
jgi:hypothetical protein